MSNPHVCSLGLGSAFVDQPVSHLVVRLDLPAEGARSGTAAASRRPPAAIRHAQSHAAKREDVRVWLKPIRYPSATRQIFTPAPKPPWVHGTEIANTKQDRSALFAHSGNSYPIALSSIDACPRGQRGRPSLPTLRRDEPRQVRCYGKINDCDCLWLMHP